MARRFTSPLAFLDRFFPRREEAHGIVPSSLAPLRRRLQVYRSPAQNYSLGGSLTLTHNLGGVPDLVQCWLECDTAEGSYEVGDQILYSDGATGAARGLSIGRTSTQLNIRYGTLAVEIVREDTGTAFVVTPANWDWLFVAVRFGI
ncbi:MAG: hypothetical protein AB1405_07790 [Bdellovibrionota bacterium]